MQDKHYFDPADLRNFGTIREFQEELGNSFFEYYEAVFRDGALTEREKALIALAVSHTVQCPYCIEAYAKTCLEKGADETEMMEAVHVAAAITSGSTLVNAVQMMRHVKRMAM